MKTYDTFNHYKVIFTVSYILRL